MAPTSDPSASSQKPPQSMLGVLFSTAASALKGAPLAGSGTDRHANSPASPQDDLHTRSLLFPGQVLVGKPQDHAGAGHREEGSSSSSSSRPVLAEADDVGPIDLQSPRDIRVIIAQDASGSQPKAVLFDSKALSSSSGSPPWSSKASTERGGSVPVPPHGPSIAELHPSPAPRASSQALPSSRLAGAVSTPAILTGAFDRPRRRDPNAASAPEINERVFTNEPVGEMRLLLDCMFGTTPLSYRGDSTKLHLFPNDERITSRPVNTSPVARESSGSWGRAEGRRKSQLSHSFTPSDMSRVESPALSSPAMSVRGGDKRTVLLTRTFAVNLPDARDPARDEDGKGQMPVTPPTSLKHNTSKRPKQRRAPMYAVALVLQIPSAQHQSLSAQAVGFPPDQGSRANSFGYKEPYSSSYEQETRSGWLFLDPIGGPTSSSTSSLYSNDVDDCVDVVTQRFDIVTRVLSSIQSTVRAKVFAMLQQTTASSLQNLPPPYAMPTKLSDEPRRMTTGSDRVPIRSTKQQIVQLQPSALMADKDVNLETERAGWRLAVGLRIPKVVTGQGRWESWREEARWTARWGGGKDQNFFLFHVLTAFLGNHTEWLNMVAPSRYRRRQLRPQTTGLGDDCAITSRTVIVGSNQAAARRLVFLLSSFLPASSAPFDSSTSTRGRRPAASGSHSHSVPTTSRSRRGSSRRPLTKRVASSRGDRERSETGGTDSASGHTANGLESLMPPDPLETQSNKTASLPIPQGNLGTRKSSATTIATMIPAITTPRFSSYQADHTLVAAEQPPLSGSGSGSLASLNLTHALRRNDSTDRSHTSSDSEPASRWGSLISGFWSNRRDSSTQDSDFTLPSEDSFTTTASGQRYRSIGRQSAGKLAQMVKQVDQGPIVSDLHRGGLRDATSPEPTLSSPSGQEHAELRQRQDQGSAEDEILQPTNLSESPLKLSVDEKDGVVDVEVQVPNFFSTSFGSPVHSPSASGFISATSLEEGSSSHSQFSTFPGSNSEVDQPVNVAGYLRRYHPDFALQAIPGYAGLTEDIRRSMRAEPTPDHPSVVRPDDSKQQWYNVGNTLIADTDSFMLKRLRLFRRMKSGASYSDDGSYREGFSLSGGQARLDVEFEEMFTEEPVFDMENTLVDAVERMTEASPGSRVSSRVDSSRHGRVDNGKFNVVSVEENQCEKTILDALDQIVKSVVVERIRDDVEERSREMVDSLDGRSQVTESLLREGVRRWLSEVEGSF